MRRRALLHGALAAGLAAPALAQPARLLRFVPQADLSNPDPVWTTATVAAIHARMIWDTLYGLDDALLPQPQMLAGHRVDDDGLTWRLTLREGLWFHDGEPVRAADCVASIRRWGVRSSIGQTLLEQTDELSAPEDRVVQFRLRRRFPLLPFALSSMYVMPARVAATDAFTQIGDYTGSGPYRFIRAEWRAGAGAAYARFDRYLPRQEPASANAGGKLVHFDRVEWKIIPDSATAAAALQRNEVDWLENPLIDLVSMLRGTPGVRVEVFDPLGSINMIAFNHTQPPFDNVRLRRAILAAVDQKEYVAANVGDEAGFGRTGVGVFTLGSPYATTAGMEALTTPRNLEQARRMVAESGYAGQPVLLMSPSDQANIAQSAQVTNALYRALGLNVQYASMDWGTLTQRRNSKAPSDKGGWNSYCTGWAGLSVANPATHLPLRGNGPGGWTGWPVDPAMEALRDAWFDAPDLAAQQAICADMQRLAFRNVPFVPTCQTFAPTAFRADLTGFMRTATPSFWGVRRI